MYIGVGRGGSNSIGDALAGPLRRGELLAKTGVMN